MNRLWSDFLTNDQRLIHKWKHYFPLYESHLERFVNRDTLLIEIGVDKGGSLQMWKRYLGPYARIIGIDINPHCRAFAEDQIEIRIGDQSDPDFLAEVISDCGTPDVVIDDGSHRMSDITDSFVELYPKLNRNGIYIVEDLHTAYWKEYDGGFKAPGSFIEKCKDLIDELNADHTRGAIVPTAFTRETRSMHFYDSVIVFEKGRHTTKQALVTGGKRQSQGTSAAFSLWKLSNAIAKRRHHAKVKKKAQDYSAKDKAHIALLSLQGLQPLSALVQQYGVSANDIERWKHHLVQKAEDLFD